MNKAAATPLSNTWTCNRWRIIRTMAGKEWPLIATALQAFIAIGIINLAFLNIAEYFIGLSTQV